MEGEDMSWHRGTWRNGRKKLTGNWRWSWAAQRYIICVDGKDPETGLRREPFEIFGENPEWGNWKLDAVKGTKSVSDRSGYDTN